jgi:hypothetical protein
VLRQGTLLGKNLLAQRANRPCGPSASSPLGEMASLGQLNAVGDILGFKVSGLSAWLIWRAIYLSRLPGFSVSCKCSSSGSWIGVPARYQPSLLPSKMRKIGLIGTLALLGLVLAQKAAAEPSARELPFAKLNRSECSKDRDDVVRRPN